MKLYWATRRDAVKLGLSLRDDDAREVRALGWSPLEATFRSWQRSDVVVALALSSSPASPVVAMAGLELEAGHHRSSALRVPAQGWLLTSPLVEQHRMSFHRAAKQWLGIAARYCSILWNRVDLRYVRAVRYLEALGFKAGAVERVSPSGLEFVVMSKEL